MLMKPPPHQNLAVRLHRDCIDITVRIRVKSGVERAVRVQSGNVVAWQTENVGKTAAEENLPVRLHGSGENKAADGADDAEVERLVEPAIGFQPGKAVARYRRSPVWCEVVTVPPAKILPSAWSAIERTPPSGFRVERISQASAGIEPGDDCASVRQCS